MSAYDGRIRGRPDRVTLGQVAVVEDFKTGAIYEVEEGAHTPRLKEGYRRQLLLYAVLVAHTYQRWPDLARVIALSGEIETFEVSAEEATKIAEEGLALLDRYNSQISRACAPLDLAQPGEAACSTCSYQAICEPHWLNADPSWQSYLSIEGLVLARQDIAGGMVALRIEVRSGTRAPGPFLVTRLELARFPDLRAVSPGSRVRITKLRPHQNGASPGCFTRLQVT